MDMLVSHPHLADLEAFALGKLDNDSLAAVEAHVAGCATCQGHAAGTSADGFVQLLRRAHAGTDHEAGTVAEAAQAPTPAPVPADGAAAGAETADLAPKDLARHERYRIVRLLGAGGMGNVYQAEHRVMQRPVALKVIAHAFTANPGAVERFRREARAAARLAHPNIVTAYDAEHAGETHFLVMEYVEGVTLARRVKERGPLPVAEACDCVRQAALGLQHAHERGMVHRDVKPGNLICCADGTVKVLDFGLAALTAERGGGLTDTNVVMGTPDYMAPEQAEDPRGADARSDVYGLGCTLHYLLTGRVPYPAPTALLKILAHREQVIPSLRTLRPNVPPELDRVVARLLAKGPEARYQTAGEVAAALEPFTRAGRPGEKRTGGKRGWLLAAVLLAGLAAAGVGVYRVQTDRGQLVITTESDDVELVVKQGGKVVTVTDAKTGKHVTLTLRSGTYELELKGAPEGLKLDIDRVTLRRGETVLARIERVPRAPSAAELPPGPGLIGTLPRRTAAGYLGTFSPDGRLIALPGDENQTDMAYVYVHETTTGRLVRKLHVPGEFLSDFAFLPDGKHLVTSTAGASRGWAFRVWDLEKGTDRLLDRVKAPGGWPAFIRVSRDARRLAYSFSSPGGSALAEVVDTATGRVLSRVRPPKDGGAVISYAVLSPDGTRSVTAVSWGQTKDGPWRAAQLWLGQLDGEKPPRKIDLPAGYFVEQPFLHPETGLAGALCSRRGEVPWLGFWNVSDGRQVRRVPVGDLRDRGRTLVGDGRRAIEWGTDHRVRLIAVPSGRVVHATDPIPGLRGWGFAPDGRVFAYRLGSDIQLYRLPDPPPAKDAP
jgi:hypothetical protein